MLNSKLQLQSCYQQSLFIKKKHGRLPIKPPSFSTTRGQDCVVFNSDGVVDFLEVVRETEVVPRCWSRVIFFLLHFPPLLIVNVRIGEGEADLYLGETSLPGVRVTAVHI